MAGLSMVQWFYGAGGEQRGPYSAEQMRALIEADVVTPDTLVWTPGMVNWALLPQTPLGGYVQGGGYLQGSRPYPAPAYAGQPYGTAAYRADNGPRAVGMGEAIRIAFRKYVTFSGRASRSEFWWFTLFNVIVSVALVVVDSLLLGDESLLLSFSNLFQLVMFLPALAVGVRRLHDTDRTGWWLLAFPILSLMNAAAMGFLTYAYVQGGASGLHAALQTTWWLLVLPLLLVGMSIAILVFQIQRGTPGPNRFG